MRVQDNQRLRRLFKRYQLSGAFYPPTEKEIFLSEEFGSYARSIAIGLLGRSCEIQISYELNSDKSASTNGQIIRLNAANCLSQCQTDIQKKALVNIGLIVHECAHLLYMDFKESQKVIDSILNGALPNGIAGELAETDKTALEEMQTALQSQKSRRVFAGLYHKIDNVIGDIHDEACICRDFGGIVRPSLEITNEYYFRKQPSYEDLIRAGNPPISILTKLLTEQMYCRDILIENPEHSNDPLLQTFQELRVWAEAAVKQDDYVIRSSYINRCLLTIWSYVKTMRDSEEDKFSQNYSQQDQQDMDDKANATRSNADDFHDELTLKQPDLSREDAVLIINGVLDALNRRMEQEEMECQVEQALTETARKQIQEVSQTSPHRGLIPDVQRSDDVSANDIRRYQDIFRQIRTISRQMQKRLKPILEDLSEGGVERRKAFGRIIEARKSFHIDGRFYATKKQPQDCPDMAILLLIDQSGSMQDARIEAAMKTAVLLDDFATGLNIPIAVIGHHTTSWSEATIHLHALFERAGDKDRYRLAQMKCDGSNRGGMALNIAVDMLNKRPEEMKLLIYISDGMPNARNYCGEAARQDLKQIAAAARAKKIQLFAAAIGEDKEQIREIYGENFLNISDLAALTKTMARLIGKRLI